MLTGPKLITLEGSEGAGKSSAITAITERLDQWGVNYIKTREPGGEDNAEKIRELLLYSEHLQAKTELLLMFAARNEHVIKVIKPALEQGLWVLSDRFVDASYAYQGFGRGIEWETIEFLEQWVVGEVRPDLTLLLDVEPQIGLDRAAQRSNKDRIEQEQINFFENIRKGYLKRAHAEPGRIKMIDANQALPVVQHQIINQLEAFKASVIKQ